MNDRCLIKGFTWGATKNPVGSKPRCLLAGWEADMCLKNKTNFYVLQGKKFNSVRKLKDCTLHKITSKLHAFIFSEMLMLPLLCEFVSANYMRAQFSPENMCRCQSYTSREEQQNTVLFCNRQQRRGSILVFWKTYWCFGRADVLLLTLITFCPCSQEFFCCQFPHDYKSRPLTRENWNGTASLAEDFSAITIFIRNEQNSCLMLLAPCAIPDRYLSCEGINWTNGNKK